MDVHEYAAGLRAAADWVEEHAESLEPGDLDNARTMIFCSTAERFGEKVAMLGDLDDLAFKMEREFVKVDRAFGPFTVQVFARAEVVLERDERLELREVNVGEWRFTEPLAHLAPLLPANEEATV